MKLKALKFKTLYYRSWPPVKNKAKELQVMWSPQLKPEVTLVVDLVKTYENVFDIEISLLGLISLKIYRTRQQDHAGIRYNFQLFGIETDFSIYDIRHWDYDNDCWEIYPDSNNTNSDL